jgi:hypothetical protein
MNDNPGASMARWLAAETIGGAENLVHGSDQDFRHLT